MEQSRSTLLPNIIHYLKKYTGVNYYSSTQLILRVSRKNTVLTDGFFAIDVEGITSLEHSTFIRIREWKLRLGINELVLVILKWEILGIETMSEYQIKSIKYELQVKALMIPAFRSQVKCTIAETPMTDILALASLVKDY